MLQIKAMNEEKKYTYKLILSYKGTQYSGWQNQTTNPNTVQNCVEKVLTPIAKYKDFQVIGASRTDTGVHASGQVLKVVLPKEVEPTNLLMGMNSKLPDDIRVIRSEFIHPQFNANKDSKSKEYHYYFTMNQSENAITAQTIYSFPEHLNLDLMQLACKKLIGEHNFLSFSTPGANTSSTIRNITKCSIEKTNFLTHPEDVYYLKIEGNGFLKYMVRIIMGALWDIGLEKLSIKELENSLSSGEKIGTRNKAPAKGLHLINIKY